MDWRKIQAVECLLCSYEALSSNLSSTKKKERKGKESICLLLTQDKLKRWIICMIAFGIPFVGEK
jgi:hypothetical protein